MNAIIIDFESTGLDTDKALITEIGAAVVDPQYEQLASLSVLVDQGQEIPPEAEKITGITTKEIRANGVSLAEGFKRLADLVECFDVRTAIAYNSQYDSKVFKNHAVFNLLLSMPGVKRLHDMDWLCAMQDLESNYAYKCWKLSHLCIDYGIAVDPSRLHRALGDVTLTRELLKASGKTIEDIATFRSTPWVLSVAKVPPPWEDGGKGTDECKKRSYRFEKCSGTEGPIFSKSWVKRVKESWVEDEISKSPFKVEIRREIPWT